MAAMVAVAAAQESYKKDVYQLIIGTSEQGVPEARVAPDEAIPRHYCRLRHCVNVYAHDTNEPYCWRDCYCVTK
jgi:hypothetical protein